MDRFELIAQAFADARACRGTVMLQAVDDEAVWVAACAAVDGTLEARVGEPPRRGLLRRRDAEAEDRLAAQGFVPGFDCRQAAVADAEDATRRVTAVLPAGATLAPRLVQPGISPLVAPPAADAPPVEHVRAAMEALVRTGAGKASFETGSPARNDAWAFLEPDGVLVHSDAAGVSETLPAGAAAERVAGLLRSEPLFVSLMDLPGQPAPSGRALG